MSTGWGLRPDSQRSFEFLEGAGRLVGRPLRGAPVVVERSATRSAPARQGEVEPGGGKERARADIDDATE